MELRRNSNTIIRRWILTFREIDFPLLVLTVAVSVFGIINMYGVAGPSSPFFQKQILFVVLGVGVMILFSFFNYRYLKNYSLPITIAYIIVVGLLVVPFFLPAIRGVRSWIRFGSLTLEPVELAKLVLIALMAKYFSQRHIHIRQLRHIIVSGIYIGIPLLIVLAQPDLGSAIIFLCIWLGILLASGMSRKQLFILLSCGLIVAYVGWLFVLKPYQKARILSFINPSADPRGAGYNLIQSKIAIGSGYWFGNGLGKGSQTKLGFLPEPHNDFVIASIADHFGFAGLSFVVLATAAIISRVLIIGERTANNFGKLFCLGMAVFLLSHAFISAGVNLGILPVTGLPFPFVSYGGSNYIALMLGLGIVQSIKRYH
ncbi:MAG TPA: FtsW/RodA/SpoVE family cell cycle protein [Candidatus Paceibacterota bacterium]